ncbi:hypothetical protein DM02DRAFT_633858 [Periconia macrospinosa]|uniref:DUF6697 domain-containing protein n=1 Tax=Periconia macrospinosa TaxID=97972 RepID=A0A2V1D891_9PLEO|nr:hypothetical protein DM02DRAFT_633858 [Periconia macrospinosa]
MNPHANTFSPQMSVDSRSQSNDELGALSKVKDSLDSITENLTRSQVSIQSDLEDLKNTIEYLVTFAGMVMNGDVDTTASPILKHRASKFKDNLEGILNDARSLSMGSNLDGANDHQAATCNVSVPPHLRKSNGVSTCSHARNDSVMSPDLTKDNGDSTRSHIRNDSLMSSTVPEVDNNDDTEALKPLPIPPNDGDNDVDIDALKQFASPPNDSTATSSISSFQTLTPPTGLTLGSANAFAWKPHFLTTLPPLTGSVTQHIPISNIAGIKRADFTALFRGAIEWSPGLFFIPPSHGVTPLSNRCYYLLHEDLEPFAPSSLGKHGAKIVPIFNPENPEDAFNLPDKYGSYSDDTPLFIAKRNVRGEEIIYYYGHYSQTRWSDKIDYDRMLKSIPVSVREHWAKKLSDAEKRPEWLTEELVKHFWPKPEYEGGVCDLVIGDEKADGEKLRSVQKAEKDLKSYMKSLQTWEMEKKFRLETNVLNEPFIMQSFERADADQPPPLRFYAEYLECVNWDPAFYKMVSRDNTLTL